MSINLPELPERLGRYERGALLGRGGMGAVFRARDPQLGRDVALKVLLVSPGEDIDALRRFLREIRALASIHDKGIVHIYDWGYDDAWHYFTMELLEGRTLSQLLATEGRQQADVVAAMGRTLAGALGAMHAAGMVHRDVKPQNVFVGKNRQVTLMDLGLVKLADATVVTAEGQTVGTPHYLAPETIVGRTADARTDVYQLGLVLYEAITARCAFEGSQFGALMQRMRQGIYTPPRTIVPSVPEALDTLIQEMMARDPAQRPATMLAVATRLRGIERQLAAARRASGGKPRSPADDASERSRVSPRLPSPRPETSLPGAWTLTGSVVALLAIATLSFAWMRASGPRGGDAATDPWGLVSPVASGASLAAAEASRWSLPAGQRPALAARLAVLEDRVAGGAVRPYEAAMELMAPDLDGLVRTYTAFVKDDERLLEEMEWLSQSTGRPSGDLAGVAPEDLVLRIRIDAWRFVLTCRRERAVLMLREAVLARARGGSAVEVYSTLAREARYGASAGLRLREFLHGLLALLEGAAARPADAGPELALVLSEVPTVSNPLAWESVPGGPCRAAALSAKASMDRLEGPAGRTLGHVTQTLWTLGEGGYRAWGETNASASLQQDIDHLVLLMPRIASQLRALKDLTLPRDRRPAASAAASAAPSAQPPRRVNPGTPPPSPGGSGPR